MYRNNDKKIVVTIEARMTSSRLPGKVLMPFAGKPALQRMIERIRHSKYADEIVVATTINKTDDCVAELCRRLGVGCFRGSEYDVLSRVLGAAKEHKADIIVELTGDCPLIDPEHIDKTIEEFFENNVDVATNVFPLSLPIGFDVQVFPVSTLEEVGNLTNDYLDRVHVSIYMYNHPEKFKIRNWTADEDCYWPEMRVTLDEKADYDLINIIFEKLLLQNENFSARDVIQLLRREPELVEINKNVRQKDHSEG